MRYSILAGGINYEYNGTINHGIIMGSASKIGELSYGDGSGGYFTLTPGGLAYGQALIPWE